MWGKAVEMMRAGRATHLDPELLDLFLGSMDEAVAILHEHRDGMSRPEVDHDEAVTLRRT